MPYTNLDIVAKAGELAGEGLLSGGEAVLPAVCACAAAELESRLRRGVSSDDISELFVTASGILAISMYMELNSAGTSDISSISAGSLSVSLKNQSELPKALRRRAEELLSAYLDCGGFEFKGVRG